MHVGFGDGFGVCHDEQGDGRGALFVGWLDVGVGVEGEADAAIEVDAALFEFVFGVFHLEPDGEVGLGEKAVEDVLAALHAAEGGDDGEVLDVSDVFELPPEEDADEELVVHDDVEVIDLAV